MGELIAARQAGRAKGYAAGWIAGYAVTLDLGYHELMAAAAEHLDNGSYLVRGGRYEGMTTDPRFWEHFQTVTGIDPQESEAFINKRKWNPNPRSVNFFSCSC